MGVASETIASRNNRVNGIESGAPGKETVYDEASKFMKMAFWMIQVQALCFLGLVSQCSAQEGVSYSYVGCFMAVPDYNNPNWNGPKFQHYDMTIKKCWEYCDGESQSYMGLTQGNKCHCDNSFQQSVGTGNCNTKCRGDMRERCGGSNAYNVYRVFNSLPESRDAGTGRDSLLGPNGPSRGLGTANIQIIIFVSALAVIVCVGVIFGVFFVKTISAKEEVNLVEK